jgi:hypothetical protein
MGKIIHIADSHIPAVAGSLLVVCLPGNAPASLQIVGGPGEFVYGVAADNLHQPEAKSRKDYPDKDIYVLGAPDA